MSTITLAHDGGSGLDREAFEGAVRELGLDLHALLERLDPARLRAEHSETLRGALARIRTRAATLHSRLRRGTPEPVDPLSSALELIATSASEAEQAQPAQGGMDWQAVRVRMTAAYDRLSIALRSRSIETPRNRPTNYLRNLYHVGNGVGILLYIHLIVGRSGMQATVLAFLGFAWSAELLRRRWPAVNRLLMRAFGTVAHPDEHWKINSATWMVTALTLLALFYSLPACAIGVAVLGVADPAAALVGRRFGRLRLRGSKTLEGTLAFVAAGAAASFAALALWHGDAISTGTALVASLVGAVPAAIAELFAGDHRVGGRDIHLDDNFVIPMVAASFGGVALALFS